MNVERLSSISKALSKELAEIKVISQLTGLVTALQQAINSPNEATQRAVLNTLEQLDAKLTTASSNELSPGVRGDIEGLNIEGVAVTDLVGNGLSTLLHEAFESGYTSVQTLDRTKEIHRQVQSLSASLDNINAAFTNLGIQDETLAPGNSVVGMSIPREVLEEGLFQLSDELDFFGLLLSNLTEIVEGQYSPNEVYSLHSSYLGIDVYTSLDCAAKFAQIVIGIKAALDILKGYRTLKEDATKLGVEAPVVEQLVEKGKQAMEQKLDEIEVEILQDSRLKDNGRLEEMKSSIRMRLNGLANRMEKGFTFEVRTSLPPDANEAAQLEAEKVKQFATIRFEPLRGPILLELPENGDTQQQRPLKKLRPRPKKRKLPKTQRKNEDGLN